MTPPQTGVSVTNATETTVLVIRIEIWPFGRESDKRHIGTAVIANDGTGTPYTGNYHTLIGDPGEEDPYRIITKPELREFEGRVENFPRLKYGPWDLLSRALTSMLGSNRLEK